MKSKILLSAAFAGLLAGAAHAEDQSGYYVSGFGGLTHMSDRQFDVVGTASDYGTAEFKNGYVLGGAVGAYIAPNWRSELEMSYRSNKVSTYYEGTDTSNLAVGGDDMSAFALMLNVWYDAPVTEQLSVHVGGGVGAAMLHLDMEDIDDNSGDVGPIKDSTWKPAAQVGAGVSWQIDDGIKANLDYRYFVTGKANFSDGAYEAEGPYRSHAVMIGLQFDLGK